MTIPTQRELKRLFKYDPKTGIFTRKDNFDYGNRLKVIYGDRKKEHKLVLTENGFERANEYENISYKGRRLTCHRAAFLYMLGYWPENDIDHINRIRYDNRWVNLREVSHSCNLKNAKLSKKNKTGIKGVHLCNKSSRFIVTIAIPSKGNMAIGRFKTLTEAAKCRYDAEKELQPDCDIDSTAKQYLQNNQIIY